MLANALHWLRSRAHPVSDLAHDRRLALEDRRAALHERGALVRGVDVLGRPGVGARVVALARVVDHPLEGPRAGADALDRRHLVLHGEDRLDLERGADPGARRADAPAALEELERVDREPHLQLLARG